MHVTLLAVGLTALLQGTPAGPDSAAVMAAVHQFVDAFNQGDTTTAIAACAKKTSIIDEFPPYEWHGDDGCSEWMRDYDADARKNGVTDGVVTLGAARHVNVTADRAYVVILADYGYKIKGKPVKETGSLLTVALHKGTKGWRITGWAWSKS